MSRQLPHPLEVGLALLDRGNCIVKNHVFCSIEATTDAADCGRACTLFLVSSVSGDARTAADGKTSPAEFRCSADAAAPLAAAAWVRQRPARRRFWGPAVVRTSAGQHPAPASAVPPARISSTANWRAAASSGERRYKQLWSFIVAQRRQAWNCRRVSEWDGTMMKVSSSRAGTMILDVAGVLTCFASGSTCVVVQVDTPCSQ